MELRFEWDGRKAALNIKKHGIGFEEASTSFGDPFGRITDDLRHSIGEERFVLLGFSERQRLIAVMFAERDEALRIFSARRATRRERRSYEEANQ